MGGEASEKGTGGKEQVVTWKFFVPMEWGG